MTMTMDPTTIPTPQPAAPCASDDACPMTGTQSCPPDQATISRCKAC